MSPATYSLSPQLFLPDLSLCLLSWRLNLVGTTIFCHVVFSTGSVLIEVSYSWSRVCSRVLLLLVLLLFLLHSAIFDTLELECASRRGSILVFAHAAALGAQRAGKLCSAERCVVLLRVGVVAGTKLRPAVVIASTTFLCATSSIDIDHERDQARHAMT
ncbi:hypothetical protein MRB53_037530 [Persea americana]|nr:hypothetical protein MRB53_037530 [Persea americana]